MAAITKDQQKWAQLDPTQLEMFENRALNLRFEFRPAEVRRLRMDVPNSTCERPAETVLRRCLSHDTAQTPDARLARRATQI